MTDFTFSPTDFAATQITVVANTQEALQYLAERYGFACVSLNIRKSAAPDLADSFEFQGLSYS
jgi:ABC-type Zn uptake system ZnuABC Zn-binding protein ZnuA